MSVLTEREILDLFEVEEKEDEKSGIDFPQISSDEFERNLSRNLQEEGYTDPSLTPTRMLAIDTAFALKKRNPSLFGKDEDPYKSLALGQASFIPESDRNIEIDDIEILRRYLRNPAGKRMREGSFTEGFEKDIAATTTGGAAFIGGAKLGYKLQQPIPASNLFAVGAKALIPVATGVAAQLGGEELIRSVRDYFYEPDLIVPTKRSRALEKAGETAAMGVGFLAVPFATTKEAISLGGAKYLDNLQQAKSDVVEQMNFGPLTREAMEVLKRNPPRTARAVAAIERAVPAMGQRAAANRAVVGAEELGFAAGAAGGRYLSERYADGDYAFPLELLGGLALGPATGLSTAAALAVNVDAIKNGISSFKNLIMNPKEFMGLKSKFKVKDQALIDVVNQIEERLIQAGEDPAAVATILEDLSKSPEFKQFTSGTMSQSPTLLRIEHEMATLFPDLKERGQAGVRSALDSYKNLLMAFAMVGDSSALRQVEQGFQTTMERAFTAQLDAASQRVLEAAERVGTGESSEAVGRALQETLNKALTAARAKERFLYSQIPTTEINVFRAPAQEGEEVGELLDIPNIFSLVDDLPTSRAALKDLPRPVQTSVNFLKEVLEDAGIDTSRLGKRGAEAGDPSNNKFAEAVQGRLDTLARKRQSILDGMNQRTREVFDEMAGYTLNSSGPRFDQLPVDEKLLVIRQDLDRLDTFINVQDTPFSLNKSEVRQIRKLVQNRMSTVRAQEELSTAGERVVQRSQEDVLADEIVDLRGLVDELREAGEPLSLSSDKLTSIRSRALAAQKELEAQGKYADARYLKLFSQYIDQDLTGALEDIAGESAPAFRAAITAARAYSRAFNDVFTRAAAPASVVGATRTGADKLSPETAVNTLFSGRSDRVYQNAKEIARVGKFLQDEVEPSVELLGEELPRYIDIGQLVNDVPDVLERALRNIRSTALRPREGSLTGELQLNMPELQRWLDDPNNQLLLGMFPKKLEDDLRDPEAAYELLMTARKQAADSMKEAQQRLSFKRLIEKGDETPTATVKGALSSEKPFFELNQLWSTIARSDVSEEVRNEARESLKSSIFDWAISGASNRDGNINPTRLYDNLFEPTASGSQVTPSEWMISKGLASEDDFKAIKTYLAEMRNYETMLSKGGIDALIDESESPLRDLALRVMGAKLGTSVSSLVGGSEASLIAAGAGSRALRALFASKSGINNMNAFKKLIEDPEMLAQLLRTERDKRTARNAGQKFRDWAFSKGFVFSRRGAIAAQDELGAEGLVDRYMPEAPQQEQEQEAPFVLTPEERALSEQDAQSQLMEQQAPLSVRNNNPGNLREAGQPGVIGTDSGFAVFQSPQAGLQAMRRQIALDTQERGMTLSQFLTKYAPPSENDTFGYIDFVSRVTGLDPDRRVPPEKITDVMRAMVQMEGGPEAVSYYFGGTQDRPRPTAQIELPPLPAPQATPAPAAPNPQSRQQYAAMFPNESVSQMIKGGIGSLA